MLEASGISPERVRKRGYVSVDTKVRLQKLKVTKSGRHVPGLLVPLLRVDGSTWGYQYRPDEPRVNSGGKPVKYETPTGQRNGIDVPPGVGEMLKDPKLSLVITEGSKKADSAADRGLACISISGVWNWRGGNPYGGKTAVADWNDIALDGRKVVVAFDSDVAAKPAVHKAMTSLAGYLESKGAEVLYAHLPDDGDGKVGLDDFLAKHGDDAIARFKETIKPDPPEVMEEVEGPVADPEPSYEPVPMALDKALAVFHKWLHLDDDDAILAVTAAVVGNLADGDPCWFLLVAPPSSAKTEIVSSIMPLPYVHLASTVTEASLLSGTSAKEKAKDATGGLLRQVGDFGILCFKDFTSTLAQNKDTAKQALAALREVYDGAWNRPVGTDGGKVLKWRGKCGLLGAVTPNIDRYGQVVSALGDRYLMLRLAGVEDRSAVVSAALCHDRKTRRMRDELAEAGCGIIAAADLDKVTRTFSEAEKARLVELAVFAAQARTVVERDGYTGDLLFMPQPEGPGRVALALKRLYGGLEAIGADEATRWRVLTRVARDCVPTVRFALLTHLVGLDAPGRTDAIAEATGMVKRTAERHLEDLALIELAVRRRDGEKKNSPIVWAPTAFLREYYPSAESATDLYPPSPRNSVRESPHTLVGAADDDTVEGPAYSSVALESDRVKGTHSHPPDKSGTTPTTAVPAPRQSCSHCRRLGEACYHHGGARLSV